MSNQDPTLDEMREYLDTVLRDYDADEFDREEAIYWFAAEYHMGQSSNLYSALSASEYRPGPLARMPSGFAAIELYHQLIGEYAEEKRAALNPDEVSIDMDEDDLEKIVADYRKIRTALRVIIAIDDGRNIKELVPDGDAYNEVVAIARGALAEWL